MNRLIVAPLLGLLLAFQAGAQTAPKKKSGTTSSAPKTKQSSSATLEEAKAFIAMSINTCGSFHASGVEWPVISGLSGKLSGNSRLLYTCAEEVDFNSSVFSYKIKDTSFLGKQFIFTFDLLDIDYSSFVSSDIIDMNKYPIGSYLSFTLSPGKRFIRSENFSSEKNRDTNQNQNFVVFMFNEPERATRVKKAFLRINELSGGSFKEDKF